MITAPRLVPSYTAWWQWWQWPIGVNNLLKVVMQLLSRVGFEPTTCWLHIHCATTSPQSNERDMLKERYVNKKPHRNNIFMHVQIRNSWIDSNQVLHIDSMHDAVIYLKRYPCWFRGFLDAGAKFGFYHLFQYCFQHCVLCYHTYAWFRDCTLAFEDCLEQYSAHSKKTKSN